MIQAMASSFASWLTELLNSKSIDGDVFGEYISGSLDSMEDASQEEIRETLVEILSGCVEDDGTCESLCQEIVEKWTTEEEKKRKIQEHKSEGQPSSLLPHITPVTGVSRDTPPAAAATAKAPGLSDLEKDRLLAKYGCEEYEDTGEPGGVTGTAAPRKGTDSGGFFESAFFENVNRSSVTEEQWRLREKQKAAHESKVERDKQNRLAQKQKAQERKEKEKKRTQKQERRR